MRLFYNLILYLSTPIFLLHLLKRSLGNKSYRKRMYERWGYINCPQEFQQGVWLHCVSVGETIAAVPLIHAIKLKYPNIPITVTTTTPTGSERVLNHFKDSVFHVYAPYDFPHAVNRFLKKVRPKLAIMMETELWPNIIFSCHKTNIPIILANGRLSKKSARRYAHYSLMIKPMLKQVTTIAAQTNQDGKRFHALGAKKLDITGNIKFDLPFDPTLKKRTAALLKKWKKDRPVWIAASTHPGEESDIINAHNILLKSKPNALLVWAPRHPEEFDKAYKQCKKAGLKVTKLTDKKEKIDSYQVYIIDKLGELMPCYAASDVAFVGGSIVPVGGHNLLEPASLAKPLLSGPYTYNFHSISKALKKAEALTIIDNATSLTLKLLEFLANKDKRETIGKKAEEVVEQNKGAIDKHMRVLSPFLDEIEKDK